MSQETYLASALLTGLFVALVAVAILRLRTWEQYTVQVPRGRVTAAADRPTRRLTGTTTTAEDEDEFTVPGERVVDRLVHSQATWYLGFVLVALGFGAVTLLVLNGDLAAATTIILLFGLVVGLYLPVGLYVVFRNRGHASARAVAETAVVLGAVLTVVIVGNLVGLG
ncbi:hypothetical protein SAMN04487948_101569 [Halogranum amylolyticum]|uniref:Uncharacterized protein n=1 Tax=Halogranum amylolyticum TaxID=660520 RepID=A0A1H8NIP2_9EURY|nr:hypothetical protein [Halogranum amylolyticum]SEO29243.1 hypothetical protein SAMN04487948_101569 [Halogranum amylolyticum]